MILADVVRTPRRSTKWLVGMTVVALTTAILGARPSAPVNYTPPAPQPSAVATAKPTPIVTPQAVMQLDDVRTVPDLIETLVRALGDASGQVREQAAIALGASGDPRALEALKKATTDPDPRVREKAVAGLVLLGLRQ